MSKRALIMVIFVLSLGVILSGCANDETDGGFIRKTYTGTIENQSIENDNKYISVNIGNDEVLNFVITDTSEIDNDEIIANGNTVEIDCVYWYESSTYEILKLVAVDNDSNTIGNTD